MGSQQGLITNIVLGIIGSLFGGFVLTLIPGTQPVESGLSIGHVLMAMVGAIAVILVVRLLCRASHGLRVKNCLDEYQLRSWW